MPVQHLLFSCRRTGKMAKLPVEDCPQRCPGTAESVSNISTINRQFLVWSSTLFMRFFFFRISTFASTIFYIDHSKLWINVVDLPWFINTLRFAKIILMIETSLLRTYDLNTNLFRTSYDCHVKIIRSQKNIWETYGNDDISQFSRRKTIV